MFVQNLKKADIIIIILKIITYQRIGLVNVILAANNSFWSFILVDSDVSYLLCSKSWTENEPKVYSNVGQCDEVIVCTLYVMFSNVHSVRKITLLKLQDHNYFSYFITYYIHYIWLPLPNHV